VPCFKPLDGYRSPTTDWSTGKRPIIFNRPYPECPVIPIACGQCIGCRLERSRQWAIRCVHEASLHPQNCFITLTYNDEHLPQYGSLRLEHFQKFMKRLRKRFGSKIRFFHCGEYGEKFQRPHYHAILFNFDFPDKKLLQSKFNDLYTSEALSTLWPYGFSTIGSVTFESAAYVARYVTKKITGPMALNYYNAVDYRNGEILERKPEYTTMSRRPGIAAGWFEKYSSDVYPADLVVMRGKEMKPPKYYDRKYELQNIIDYTMVKFQRIEATKALKGIDQRLDVKEQVATLRLQKQLTRGYENGKNDQSIRSI